MESNQSKWKPHLQYMKDKGISISGFAETNTNWQYKNIKRQISAATNSIFQNFSLAFTDNRFNPPDRSSYLPGGCLQLCTDHWTSRITETIKDPRRMGRWIGQKFHLREGKTLSVITAYRPCQQSITDVSQSSTTVTYQPKVLFTKDKQTEENPRKTLITDIIKVVKDIEKNPNNFCILLWDANKSIDDTSSGIKKIIKETSLVDAFAQVAGEPRQFRHTVGEGNA
jgi:hypothetical protein